MKLDLENIKKIAQSIKENNLSEVTIELNGTKLIMKKEQYKQENNQNIKYIEKEIKEDIKLEKKIEVGTEEIENSVEISSPMVGTFYAAPSQESDDFVKLGDKVEVGDTLCIVEAMKMMNEVKSTVAGTIVGIKGEDGKIIRKGEVLFLVKKK